MLPYHLRTAVDDDCASRSETILGDILDTMHNSDVFPQPGKDTPSRFWSAYERMAKQHDDEFLERHNGDMDALLIFVSVVELSCLFQLRLNQ